MDIIIISHFCMDFSLSDNDRFLYIANELAKEHKVEVITSDFYHTEKRHRSTPVYKQWPFKITFLHEIGYPKNICVQRFFSDYIWGKNVKKYLEKRKKPDVIYCAVPSLYGPYLTAGYCDKNNVRFIIDIQDLWPEAFKLVFDIPVLSDLIYYPFNLLANFIYRKADSICAVSETYAECALKSSKNCKEGIVVFLGTDLNKFDMCNVDTSYIVKGKDECWIAYCGTLGSSYDLNSVIKSLDIIKSKGWNAPKLVVMGDGPLMDKFKQQAISLNVDCEFTGRLNYDEMCSLLKRCDITVNPIMPGAAQSIINKHADYAASGLPVLNTQESREYRELVEKYDMGINCKNCDAEDLANQIKFLCENVEIRKRKGLNARRCAEEKFDRKKTYAILVEICEKSNGMSY